MKTEENNLSKEIKNFIIILLSVMAFLAVFYFVAYILSMEPKASKAEENIVTEIQYDEILVGEILSKEDSYYILAAMEDDYYVGVYEEYINIYSNKEESLPIYKVDLESVFNKNFVAEESNFEFDDLSEIRFSETSLLFVENGIIASAYETYEEIQAELKRIKE